MSFHEIHRYPDGSEREARVAPWNVPARSFFEFDLGRWHDDPLPPVGPDRVNGYDLRLLHAALEQEIASTGELVLDQQLQELDVGEVVGDGLLVAHRQGLYEAREAEIAKLALELGGHDPAPAVVNTAYSLRVRMMDQGHQRLRQVLALEREALRRVQALLARLEDDDPDRELLERHRDMLADAIAHLEQLLGGSQPGLCPPVKPVVMRTI